MTATQTLQDPIRQLDLKQSPQDGSEITLEDNDDVQLKDEAQRHPLGVKPSGNALTSKTNFQHAMGRFSTLPDSTVLLLLEYLDASSLVRLGSTCKAFFAYSTYDQLWRDLATNQTVDGFHWRGSWRASLRKLSSSSLPDVDCSCLFSDALYRPYQCSQVPLLPFANDIPRANRISRLSNLSAADFNQSWTDTPFILTEPVTKWKVFEDWDEQALLENHADTVFRAEAVDWPLQTYIKYMSNSNDESPLYLFDRGFAEKMKLEIGPEGDYDSPLCFGEDLFTLLGDSRPDHRWLIVGPERSGSTFHKDPNATSAWNAVIRGSKYWIMFPNAVIPPGVYMSEDQSEVTSPLSIGEWLLTFHDEARNTPGCIEGVCGKGEVLHVPSGWWHLVVNLEPAIALTQNFVPKSHLRAAVNFLKNKADQVSGFKDDVKDPHALFMDRLQAKHPDLFAEFDALSDRKRKWEDVIGEDLEQGDGRGVFSFGFGDDTDEDI